MKLPRTGKHPPRNMGILLLAVAVLSVIGLVWMGIRLVRQDRALEMQQLDEKRESAADRIVAALEQILMEEEGKLGSIPSVEVPPGSKDVIWIDIESSGFNVRPENVLLFYPGMSPGHEAPARLYAAAESAEFRDRNYARAIGLLRPLSTAGDPAVKAGAELRLARNLKKAGRMEEALGVYRDMIGLSDREISVAGAPANIAAHRALCLLLEEEGRTEELEQEARYLLERLNSGNWRLDQASYLYYRDQVVRWLGEETGRDTSRLAMAEAATWVWQNRLSLGGTDQKKAGRRSLTIEDISFILLWQSSAEGLTAIVAGPEYQRNFWFDPVIGDAEFSHVHVGIRDAEGRPTYGGAAMDGVPQTLRFTATTGLPWDIALINADVQSDLSQFAQRRRLMMIGLGLLVLLVIAASYFISRAVSRELAAARLQSDFVSAVSHEFRTPLTSMRQFTEMLVEDENLPPEKRRDFYLAQERATRRLSRLVESLLDFGRMEAGARPYKRERINVGQLVAKTAEEFRQEVESSDVAMDCSVPNDGPVILGDSEALGQALWNLLDNAVKYSGDNSSIRIEVEEGDPVAVRVMDRGVGIPSAEMDRIFRKFVRGSSANASGVKGTGIGLAMVHHIVAAHAGTVSVDSEPGRGSTFTILLPAGG